MLPHGAPQLLPRALHCTNYLPTIPTAAGFVTVIKRMSGLQRSLVAGGGAALVLMTCGLLWLVVKRSECRLQSAALPSC